MTTAADKMRAALQACEIVMDTAAIHGLPQQLPPAYRDSWAAAHEAAREVLSDLVPLVADYVDEAEQAKADRDECRKGYHQLDRNWEALQSASVNAFRAALDMPDATIPEMCEQIAALRRGA